MVENEKEKKEKNMIMKNLIKENEVISKIIKGKID